MPEPSRSYLPEGESAVSVGQARAGAALVHEPPRAIACMIGGGALLTLQDAIMKWMTASYPIGEVLFLRGVFVFLPIAWLAWRAGGVRAIRPRNVKWQLARGGVVVVSAFLFFTGLSLLPLADTVAITFAGPLFVTALAPTFLGEKVGWRRWTAVLVGFAGVILMLRPGSEALRLAALLPLAGAFGGAVRDMITRRISATDTSTATLFVTTLAVTLAGLATLPFAGWRVPTAFDLGLFLAAGVVLGGAHYLMIEAFRLGEVALVAPFKYASVIWAVILGFIVWGDLPDAWMIAGATLVVLSGLYILHRETRTRRSRAGG